jgi:hypothetical protein
MSDTPAKPATLDDILAELTAIRLILASRPTPPPPQPRASSPAPATSATGANVGDEPIPQPNTIIANAGDVQVHFGKNSGKPLSEIGERSLSWYAAEQAPRLGNNGKPFPPRPQDVLLKNAARTLWHQLRGTLATGLPTRSAPAQNTSAPQPTQSPGAGGSTGEENVPF